MGNPLALDQYFSHIPQNAFFEALLGGAQRPFDAMRNLTPALEALVAGLKPQGQLPAHRRTAAPEPGLQLRESIYLESDFFDAELKIFVGKGSLLEAGATLKPLTYLEPGVQVRQGAYIRGGFYACRGSVIGHTTEVKNSVFFSHVEAGHFTYVGDSLIGAHSNLGAGTKVSNLEFRSAEQKRDEIFPELNYRLGGQNHPSGLSKFGAVLGDGTEAGCNSVISPMVLLGKDSWVLPNLCLPKGVYPPQSRLFNLEDCRKARL
ncbi:MAG: hypothetical protein RRB13_14405 [bacterium]|nr:hypothetical protein [bacterium]